MRPGVEGRGSERVSPIAADMRAHMRNDRNNPHILSTLYKGLTLWEVEGTSPDRIPDRLSALPESGRPIPRPGLLPGAPEPPGASAGVIRRPLRQPSAAEHCALLLAGWSTTGRRGVYERVNRRVWWSRVAAGGAE